MSGFETYFNGSPKGKPRLPENYWEKLKNTSNEKINAIFDENINFTLKDSSIFGNKQKDI